MRNMYYLVRTVTTTGHGEHEIESELFAKSSSKEKLQAKIKQMFNDAVENMNEDVWINNCSREDFDDNNGYFDENNLLIDALFTTPGMERETINYAIVSDENVKEI